VIGLWAAGAMLYMANATPNDPSEVHYPLVQWSFTAGTDDHPGDFTSGSRRMALAMLATLPVALVLLVTAVMMWRRLSRRPR
jgi:hypothetical protein